MRQSPTARRHQKRVHMPMIAALELHDQITPGESTRQSDRRHRRFRSAAHHPHFFDGGHPLTDRFGHVHLIGIRNAKAHPLLGGVIDRLQHHLGRMPQNGRPPGADIIDERFAVHILNAASFGPPNKERLTTHIAESPHGTVHTSRDVLFGSGKKFLGKGA